VTESVATTAPGLARPGVWARARQGRTLPILTVLAALLVVWYAGALLLNAPRTIEQFEREDRTAWSVTELAGAAFSMDRPVLPTPDQIAVNLWQSTVEVSVTSRRSLVYHAFVTISATLTGFVLGTALGILIAIGIVHVRTLDRSLMPWVIASQTIPILAIAPMVVVVLGNMGFTGLMPKALISAYLSFFPVTIGMVKGLRAPDPLQFDLMRTYSADRRQLFAKLRWPSSIPFLFPSLKVGIALSLVGAIVAELPTGAQAGIGARLLTGSYYGQMVGMWAALMMAAFLAMLCIFAVNGAEKLVAKGRGGRI
jgi:NitT/TauT family transport system permease protein